MWPNAVDAPAFPQLSNALFYAQLSKTLGERTRTAHRCGQFGHRRWNVLLLSFTSSSCTAEEVEPVAMHRRHFLHGLARPAPGGRHRAPDGRHAGHAARAGRVPARRLATAASLLVPTSSSFYYEQRPNIAIARPGAPWPMRPCALNADCGVCIPALADSMLPLFEQQQLAFVPFAGTDDVSRSHFETQDRIELGQALVGTRDFQSGFMNRLAQVLGARDAIAFTDQLPLTFRGAAQVPNLSLNSLTKETFLRRTPSEPDRRHVPGHFAGRTSPRRSFARA